MEAIAPEIKKQMKDMVVQIKRDFVREPKPESFDKKRQECSDLAEEIKIKGINNIVANKIKLPTWMIFWRDQLKEYVHKFRYSYEKRLDHVLKKYLLPLCEDSKIDSDQSKSNYNFVNWGEKISKPILDDEIIFQISSVFYNKVHTYKDKPKTLESLDSRCILEFGLNYHSLNNHLEKRDLKNLKDLRNELCHVEPTDGVKHAEYTRMFNDLSDIVTRLRRLESVNTTDVDQLISDLEGDVRPKCVYGQYSAPGASAGLPEKCFGISDILSDRLGKSKFRDLNKVVAIVMKKAKKEHLEKIIPNC